MARRLEIATVLALCGVAAGAWFAPWERSEGPDARPAARPAPVSDEAAYLAHEFEAQVMAELARRADDPRTETAPRDTARAALERNDRSPRLWSAGADDFVPRSPRVDRDDAFRRADWEYLNDVYAGRVTGIPNERKAGVTVFEMAALGNVPYVDQLRAEGDLEALRDLGFTPEPAPPPGPPKEWSGGAPIRERRFLNPRLEGGQF